MSRKKDRRRSTQAIFKLFLDPILSRSWLQTPVMRLEASALTMEENMYANHSQPGTPVSCGILASKLPSASMRASAWRSVTAPSRHRARRAQTKKGIKPGYGEAPHRIELVWFLAAGCAPGGSREAQIKARGCGLAVGRRLRRPSPGRSSPGVSG